MPKTASLRSSPLKEICSIDNASVAIKDDAEYYYLEVPDISPQTGTITNIRKVITGTASNSFNRAQRLVLSFNIIVIRFLSLGLPGADRQSAAGGDGNMKVYKGFTASPGLVLGQVSRLDRPPLVFGEGPFHPEQEKHGLRRLGFAVGQLQIIPEDVFVIRVDAVFNNGLGPFFRALAALSRVD